MNFKKYTAAALVILLASPMVAQKDKKPSASQHKIENITDVDAAIKGIEAIVHNNLADVEPVVAQICESQQTKKQKCPEIYVGAANAFWTKSGVSDTTYAQRYIDKAIAVAPNYAPAYILKADIYKWADDTTKAVSYYKKAIQMAPTDLRGYNKYIAFKEIGLDKMCKDAMEFQVPEEIEEARARRGEVEAILKEAKNAIPTYPYKRECARLYAAYSLTTNEMKKGVKLYEEAEKDSLLADDYASWARMVYTFIIDADGNTKLDHYRRIINICDSGLMAFPTDYYVLSNGVDYANRAFDLVKKQNGEALAEYKTLFSTKALDYAERLMATKDTTISCLDHLNYGKALINNNKYSQGIDELTSLLENPKILEQQETAAMGLISDAYKSLGEYDKAESTFENYIEKLKSKGTLEYRHLQNYALLFVDKAEESFGQEQQDAYKRALELYGQAAQNFPQYAANAYLAQLNLCDKNIDPDQTLGTGVQPAKKLYEILLSNGNLSDTQTSWLTYATSWLAVYYFKIADNRAAAKQYWVQWYKLSPNNPTVVNVLTKIYKMKL